MQIVSLSGPQKITGMAILIGIAAIIVFVVSDSLAPAPSPKAHVWQPQPTTASLPAPVPAASADISGTSAAPSPAAKVQLPAAPAAYTGAKKQDAWSLGNGKSSPPQIALNKVIRDYEVIEINQHPEAIPQVGETVSLPMLNGKKILVDVQATTLNPNGDKSWSGHLQGYGEDYPIIMTYGAHAIFAMITTPEGSYTMESSDGVGWLYKNPSELELSDTSSNDFLEIPHSL